MSSRRALAGASAADAGARFERDLLTAHRPAGVALSKVAGPWKMARIGGELRPVPNGPPVADFVGTVHGRHYALEAKATSDDRWELKHLEAAQAAYLDLHLAAGAVALVLLRFDAVGEVYALPWGTLAPLYRRWEATVRAKAGEASVTRGWCAENGRVVRRLVWWEGV